ncbi:IS21-like element helper ATPase IstB [Alteromonas sp. W364]|uniref:IS21-like element helper ATPase IstB n=1 Tax=Alteromonas sp. W364 TaxID=3075610 RepID=UPI002887FB16|nr:IS21-like element helper ATPase IstB [Alteromonas sp. W364]MDT0627464.1 IS21-like element helper ATPase IstB [Alteromonas sp. W364]
MNKTELIRAHCKSLKLDGFLQVLEHEDFSATSHDEFLEALLSSQLTLNSERKIKRLTAQAKLKYEDVYLSDIDYGLCPSLKVNQVNQLGECHWVDTNKNVIIIGATGTGKTSLACRFAQEVIAKQQSVMFYRLSHLLLELVAADKEGELMKLLKKLTRFNVLIIDDWGNALMDKNERHLLFELIEYREQKGALLITSQYPISAWHETFGNETIADSVLDRIVHNSHRINLKGESIRKLLAERE